MIYFLISVDEQYHILESLLLATGRGRRPNIPACVCNNRLIIQLIVLRNKWDFPWDSVNELFGRLFPTTAPGKFYRIRLRCLKAAWTFTGDEREFLYATVANLEYAGPGLNVIGIERCDLLGDLNNLRDRLQGHQLTNGVLYELEKFREKESLPWINILHWIKCFGMEFDQSTESRVKNAVKNVTESYRKLSKSKHKKDSDNQKFTDFCSEPFRFESIKESNVENVPHSTSVGLCATETESSCVQLQAMATGIRLRHVQGKLEEAEKEIVKMKLELTVCQNDCTKKEEHITELKEEHITELKENVKMNEQLKLARGRLGKEKSVLSNTVTKLQSENRAMRQSNYYKRLQRKESQLRQDEHVIRMHKNQGCGAKISKLKKEVKTLQTVLSNQRKTIEDLRQVKKNLKDKAEELEKECDMYIVENEENSEKNLVTKVGNKFTDNIIRCVIQLIGEVNIGASRISQVIQCVSKCLYGRDVCLDDLPSVRSSLRFADRGHVLAQYHVADSILVRAI